MVGHVGKIKDSDAATAVTFEHAGLFLREVNEAYSLGFEGLFEADRQKSPVVKDVLAGAASGSARRCS